MSFHVHLTARARADLDRLMRASEDNSQGGAARLSARFSDALDRLESSPQSCGPAYKNSSFDEEIRHLLVRVHKRRIYRALFHIQGDEVVIVAVRAPGERPVTPTDLGE